jgi:hypothetical protein
VDETPKPAALPSRPPSPIVAYQVTFRTVPNRTTVQAARICPEDGWVKLKDDQGDVAAFPAGAILSIIRRPAGSTGE